MSSSSHPSTSSNFRSRLGAVLFWSVLAAAFIGPGTVTTAAAAGAAHGHRLLWALAFSTLACAVLQEASARLTAASGRDLAQALGHGVRRSDGLADTPRGPRGLAAAGAILVMGAVVMGCAAYQAGNLLGAAAGVGLALPGIPAAVSAPLVSTVLAGLAALLLWRGNPRFLARGLGVLVAVMGTAFAVTAVALGPPAADLARGLTTPAWPPGAGLLVLGLVGTTVVPYNLFLGSGLARRANPGASSSTTRAALFEQRWAIAIAVGLGGLVSMAVLVTGTAVTGEFSFQALAVVLESRLGPAGRGLFAFGLFAAGLSSALTAPLAAALTARGVLGPADPPTTGPWSPQGRAFRATWLAVLLTGAACAGAGLRPIPVILAAQAFNGLLLPIAALFLILTLNNPRRVPAAGLNGPFANLAQGVVTAVALLLGLTQLARAAAGAGLIRGFDETRLFQLAAVATVLLALPVVLRARQLRRMT